MPKKPTHAVVRTETDYAAEGQQDMPVFTVLGVAFIGS